MILLWCLQILQAILYRLKLEQKLKELTQLTEGMQTLLLFVLIGFYICAKL
jgi:hypothetical protein